MLPLFDKLPPRPKRMRRTTYRRLETLSGRPQIQGTSAIHVEIHSLLRDIAEAERSIGRKAYASDEGIDATLPLMHKLLEELQDQLPQLPRSMADCVAFAEIAQHWRKTDPADVDSFLRAARPLVAEIHSRIRDRRHTRPCCGPLGSGQVQIRDRALAESPGCKIPKTLDDIAALAVLPLYWALKELADKCAEDRIAIGDRALPTLLLAVSEFFGIDRNAFASSQLAQETNSSPRLERDFLKSDKKGSEWP